MAVQEDDTLPFELEGLTEKSLPELKAVTDSPALDVRDCVMLRSAEYKARIRISFMHDIPALAVAEIFLCCSILTWEVATKLTRGQIYLPLLSYLQPLGRIHIQWKPTSFVSLCIFPLRMQFWEDQGVDKNGRIIIRVVGKHIPGDVPHTRHPHFRCITFGTLHEKSLAPHAPLASTSHETPHGRLATRTISHEMPT